MPEIEIYVKLKVYMCYRCGHLWEKRSQSRGLPITCPGCSSPYWNSRGKKEKKLLPLKFHGEEVLDSNFEKVYGSGVGGKDKESRKK